MTSRLNQVGVKRQVAVAVAIVSRISRVAIAVIAIVGIVSVVAVPVVAISAGSQRAIQDGGREGKGEQ